MTELSQKILENYQIRKSKKQKLQFIDFLKTYIPQLQVQEGGFPKNRNLIIGDPQKAKIILGAHYDTCARLPFPNFITPKQPLLSIGYSLLVAVPVILLIIGANFLSAALFNDLLLNYWVTMFLYLAIMWLMLGGPANKHTANDNTSGVITLLEIYQQMDPQAREDVCFVLFDNEETGLIGSGYFRKKHKKVIKGTLMVNFDCVSDGDHFLLGISKKANQKYRVDIAQAFTPTDDKQVMLENLKKLYYPSDQAGFPVAVSVAALKYKKPFGYYMDKIHTDKDRAFDERNIAFLTDRTIRLIQNI